MSAEPTLGQLGIVVPANRITFDSIVDQLNLDLGYAYKRAANRHLARIRQVVNEHNLHRHTLTVSRTALGWPKLEISGVPWYALESGQPAFVVLRLLGMQIEDAASTWGKYLIDAVI